jgi:hypothetical protein
MSDTDPQSALQGLVGLVMLATIWAPGSSRAGFYECRAASGAPIYTDSPAQLDQCRPVASGGSSHVGLVGGASSAPTPLPTPAPITSPSMPLPTRPSDPQWHVPELSDGLIPPSTSPGGLADGSAGAPPCLPGINPLNPFGGPPCPVQDSAPLITTPAADPRTSSPP